MRQMTQGIKRLEGASESALNPVRPAAIAFALLTLLLGMSLTGCGLTNSGAKQVPASVAQLKIATPTLPAAQIQGSYQASLAASGGKSPYTWTVASGALPAGLALTSATGTISGKPSQAGAFSFAVQVKDSSSPLQTASAPMTLNVSSATSSLKIVNASLPAGQVGVAYQTSNTASGGTPPYTWSITSGALPVGLALSASSGAISGKPSVSGSSTFMVRVSDAASNWAQQPLSIQIGATTTPPSSALKITTTSLLAGAVGQGYSTAMQATGGTPGYSWSVASGNFPPGLQFDSTSGAIGGVPTVAGQYTFVAQVSDSAMPAQTASQSISIAISASSTTNVGLGSTIAGGLMALPPSRQLGTNVLPNGGLESGIAGWYIPKCWAVDSTVAHSGTSSLRFTAGGTCAPAYTPAFTFQANTSYTIGVWAKTSSGSNLQAKINVVDSTNNGLPVAGGPTVSLSANWTFLSVPDVDLLALHIGDQLQAHLVVSAPTGQTPTGSAWFDDVSSQPELPLPISAFLLYPNFRGYLWQSGPQQIRLQVNVANPSGASVQIGLQLEGGNTISTVQQAAQATQEIDIDGSQLAPGSYLLHTAVVNNGQTITYPDYRVTKVSGTFKNSLVSYVDTDNFLVHNGQKEFVWGVYDRDSIIRCSGCMYTTAAQYESNIAGFNGMGTLANYQDTQLNAMTNFAPWSAMSPGPPAVFDQLDPAMQALQARGVGYIQTVNNWISGNQYRPNWATSLNDPQLWQLAATMMAGKSGGLGYYTYDEPPLNLLPGVFAQNQTLREDNPGSVTWGALVTANQIYRWRDASDVVGADPYPVGIPEGVDEYALGNPEVAATSPSYVAPTLRVTLWTKGTEQQVYNSRPVWMVLQLWRQWGQFPVYEQMKQSAYKAIIGGANGIMWWGFVSAAGMEEEVDTRGNLAAYTDFKRISTEVQALQPYLIATPQPQMLSSVSDPKIETLVKADSKEVVIFATSDSAAPVSNVTFNLSSLVQSSATSVTVYSEGRTLAFSGNTFTDSFAPYEAHVYIITLP